MESTRFVVFAFSSSVAPPDKRGFSSFILNAMVDTPHDYGPPLTEETLRAAMKLFESMRPSEPMILLHPGETGVYCRRCGSEMRRVVQGAPEFGCTSCGHLDSSPKYKAALAKLMKSEGVL